MLLITALIFSSISLILSILTTVYLSKQVIKRRIAIQRNKKSIKEFEKLEKELKKGVV